MSDYTPVAAGTGARARIQRGGAFLAGMIMPNLGAFIAWGLVTALFIPNGWVNEIARATGAVAKDGVVPFAGQASSIVGPIIVFLLPILIGYTGGRTVHGQRGAVVGAIATIGVIVSPLALGLAASGGTPPKSIAELGPQFLGALIIGPLAALLLKWIDSMIDGKLRGGFEMLVDNFTSGIVGGFAALVGVFALGPAVFWLTTVFANFVDALINAKLLPLASIIIEPAKILFLNNAIGNGVLVPLAAKQAAGPDGKSILFMLESNPGPGLGILVAMMLFGPIAIRATVPAAIVVQFLGGIHEIYFPYVLMKPILLIGAIAGGASGVLMFSLFNDGLLAPASPGSIFAYILVAYPGDLPTILLGILVSAGVAFIVSALLLGFGRNQNSGLDLEAAREQSARNKNKPATAPVA
ncbi:PTS transporter subunit EIIC [Frigoribacterium sp. CG_9.8]|uniref:PTS transporter subunit EIIC n=1 Tax=Frigoribacterium sp. CG_9.8 TaxID=2787733 RepID=UPI0018CA4A32|nr:PTS transporter subunit EIIC [Frigoribacterium sp. CG_9.8]MBG6108117.1 PTS system mannitol-specific IIC component [Frigoribacterium sp. CG_9.8]